MSDVPGAADEGGEEFDLGEIEETEDGAGETPDDDAGGGGEGDAGGDEGEGQEEGEGDVGEAAPPPRQGRKSQAQRWRERAERAEREAAEARGFQRAFEQFRPQQQPQVDPATQARLRQERLERLNMMSPAEAAEFVAAEKEQQFQQALVMQQLTIEDRIDKRDFDQQARTSRLHSQYRDAVERELGVERQRGNLRATREEILHRLVGRDVADRASRAAPQQRRNAQRRVAGQQTRPTNGRGDGGGGGRRPQPGSAEADEALVAQYFREGGRL